MTESGTQTTKHTEHQMVNILTQVISRKVKIYVWVFPIKDYHKTALVAFMCLATQAFLNPLSILIY
jgi:hypothetical protein